MSVLRCWFVFALVGLLAWGLSGPASAYGIANGATVFSCRADGVTYQDSSAMGCALKTLKAAENQVRASGGCAAYGCVIAVAGTCNEFAPRQFTCGGDLRVNSPSGEYSVSFVSQTDAVSVLGCVDNAEKKSGASQCTCKEGFRPGASGPDSCVPYACPAGGMALPTGYGPYSSAANAAAPVVTCISSAGGGAYGGCQYRLDPTTVKTAGGQYWNGGTGSLSGKYCDSAITPTVPATVEKPEAPSPPDPPCPAAQCPGTIGGTSVCVPCAESAKGPSESASSPGELGPAAPPGATSKDVSTTCTGTTCTTDTTYKDGTGAVVGGTSKTEGKGTFCSENPGSPLCTPSSIGGACESVTCTGDAIQCSIAREQARRNCEFFGATAATELGKAAGVAGLRPDGHPANTPSSESVPSSLDMTDRIGAAGGLSDMSFSLAGVSTVIPLATLNEPLAWVGRIFVALTAIACVFIMFRSA